MAGENDITITVDADNNTTAAFGAAARGANTVGDAVNNANRSFREADNRYQQASLRLQQLAARQQDAARRANDLRQEITAARFAAASMGDTSETTANRIREMSRQQEEATRTARLLALQHGRSTEQVNDLARAYRRAERNAQEALRASLMFGAGARLGPDGRVIGNSHGNIIPGGDDGPGFFSRMLSRLPGLGGLAANGAGAAGGATSNPVVGSAVLAAGAGLAAVLAPLLGGAVTGAIGGAAGMGGVGLGVAGAVANDPEAFRERWGAVVEDVTNRWVKASASWVEPLKGSIDEVDAMMRRLPIEDILSNSAAYLDPLTKGLTGFGANLGVGLDSLVRDVGPIVEMLGKRLPQLGDDLGQFFAALGTGAEGGATALDDLLHVIGQMTHGLGVTLAALAQMYQGIHDGAAWVRDAADAGTEYTASLMESLPILNRWADDVRGIFDDSVMEQGVIRFRGAPEAESDFERVKKAATDAAQALKDYVEATKAMLAASMSKKSTGLALSEGWITLNKELREGKRTLDLNTQAGVDNQRALLNQVAAAEAAREAQLALGEDIYVTNAQFDANIERIRQMAYSLGYNKQQVDELIRSLGVLDVTSAAPKVEVVGAQAAMQQGIALGALLNNIAHTYTAKVQVVTGPGISLGNALHHPIGGPTSPGLSVVNDWGGQGAGEVMSLPTGTMVYGGAQARRVESAAGGGQSGGTGGGYAGMTPLLLGSDGSRLGNLLMEVLAATVSAQGGRQELLGLKTGASR